MIMGSGLELSLFGIPHQALPEEEDLSFDAERFIFNQPFRSGNDFKHRQ